MSSAEKEADTLLRENGLRVTAKRREVLKAILEASKPLSHTQVVALVAETGLDPATVYRNLIKLRDAGLIEIASRANGIDRYSLVRPEAGAHSHPHFVCDDCGEVSCLPVEFSPLPSTPERWADSIQSAAIQLRGECPDCIDSSNELP